MPDEWNRETLSQLSGDFMRARILLSAAELDLFTILKQGARTAEEICAEKGWDERGLRILLDALVAVGLVEKEPGGRYRMDEPLARLLGADHPETILPMLQHRIRMWRTWSNLTEVVAAGSNPDLMGIESRPIEDLHAFIGAMQVIGARLAEQIAAAVDLSRFKRMLDVGGGSGVYTAAFLRRAPHLLATLFDLPTIVEISRQWLVRTGVMQRVELVAGDYETDELPTGFDLVLLSAIIHSNSREENRALYRKCHRALEPGGTVLIRDFVMNGNRTFPPEGAIFAVNMLVATKGGDTFTFDEIGSDLEAAGFGRVRLLRDNRNMDQVVSAVKP